MLDLLLPANLYKRIRPLVIRGVYFLQKWVSAKVFFFASFILISTFIGSISLHSGLQLLFKQKPPVLLSAEDLLGFLGQTIENVSALTSNNVSVLRELAFFRDNSFLYIEGGLIECSMGDVPRLYLQGALHDINKQVLLSRACVPELAVHQENLVSSTIFLHTCCEGIRADVLNMLSSGDHTFSSILEHTHRVERSSLLMPREQRALLPQRPEDTIPKSPSR